jgi:hypothetical protein
MLTSTFCLKKMASVDISRLLIANRQSPRVADIAIDVIGAVISSYQCWQISPCTNPMCFPIVTRDPAATIRIWSEQNIEAVGNKLCQQQ